MEKQLSFPDNHSDPELIVAAIRQKRTTLRAVAKRYGLPVDAISSALRKPYAEAEHAISRFLEIDARTLWPERYNANGQRKQPQPKENYRPQRRFHYQQEAA